LSAVLSSDDGFWIEARRLGESHEEGLVTQQVVITPVKKAGSAAAFRRSPGTRPETAKNLWARSGSLAMNVKARMARRSSSASVGADAVRRFHEAVAPFFIIKSFPYLRTDPMR